MSLLSPKKDKFSQNINPGDICVRQVRERNKMTSYLEFVIYKEGVWGGTSSKGEFGRFITPNGIRTIKYSSVVFAFDPLSERRSRADSVLSITKQFYEGNE